MRRADPSSKRIPPVCGASLCVIKKPRVTRRPEPALGCRARGNTNTNTAAANNNNNNNI
jgi:hypothetical protein